MKKIQILLAALSQSFLSENAVNAYPPSVKWETEKPVGLVDPLRAAGISKYLVPTVDSRFDQENAMSVDATPRTNKDQIHSAEHQEQQRYKQQKVDDLWRKLPPDAVREVMGHLPYTLYPDQFRQEQNGNREFGERYNNPQFQAASMMALTSQEYSVEQRIKDARRAAIEHQYCKSLETLGMLQESDIPRAFHLMVSNDDRECIQYFLQYPDFTDNERNYWRDIIKSASIAQDNVEMLKWLLEVSDGYVEVTKFTLSTAVKHESPKTIMFLVDYFAGDPEFLRDGFLQTLKDNYQEGMQIILDGMRAEQMPGYVINALSKGKD